ncbi:MAG: LysM peptidoglycan-binding domain-containing protein [Muribaculaceae bacterium]|nr:LysM peptidoglycan-binding domain-containing protein [Muribaculaceae bacterium]
MILAKPKKIVIFVVLSIVLTVFTLYGESTSKLSRTEILGTEYYIYEVKKGESVYGIAKRFNWDLEELLRLNPEAGGSLTKGARLYYPTGNVSVVTEMPEPVEIDLSQLEPIRHKVKKGETVYSISRQYGVPLDIIYKYNPAAKKGVKQGEIIEMPQSGNAQFYYYTVKKGDTLSSISIQFNTNVEDILRNNAGLTVGNLQPGETIRISVNSNVGKVKTELVAEEKVKSITGYKVSKNESWEEISEKTGIQVEVLKEANEDRTKPKENSVVNIPVVETIEIEKQISYEVPAEMSQDEVREIYDSIKGVGPDERLWEGVKMALILDEPSSKKDVDFTRGVLVALSQMKNLDYKIDLKVMDGRVSSANLIDELDDYEPNLIISTADRAFPLFLADYGNTNNVQIVNVFDLKNDLYEDNASMVQILPPSSIFNDKIASQLYKDNSRRKLMMIGEPDENDGIAEELRNLYNGEEIVMTLEEFGSLEPDIMESVVIYSYASKKEDVSDFLKNIENLSDNFPGFTFKIIGRTSWIAMLDDFGDQFNEYSVSVPSRVWLNEESKEWKSFVDDYEVLFDGQPVRSIPNFAATGYDIAQYFIPQVATNKGDFNLLNQRMTFGPLQNDIILSRVNNWGGFINGAGYIIKFKPDGSPERKVVK